MNEFKCPYCGEDYSKEQEELYYYFPNALNAFNDNDLLPVKTFFSMIVDENKDIFRKHGIKGSEYLRRWNLLGQNNEKRPEPIQTSGASGVIISSKNLLQCLVKRIEIDGKIKNKDFLDEGNLKVRNDKGLLDTKKIEQIFIFLQENLKSVNSNYDMQIIEDPEKIKEAKQYAAFPVDSKNAKLRKIILNNYSVYLYDLAVVKIRHDTDIMPTAVACKACENFLPIEYFACKHIVISLIGGTSVGKTTFTLALIKSGFENIIRNTEKSEVKLEISGRLIPDIDKRQTEFTDQLENVERHLFPDGTNYPMPGVFLRMKLKFPPRKCMEFILCIMDTVGELWKNPGENTLSDVSWGVDQSDAFIFLFDGYVEKNVEHNPVNNPEGEYSEHLIDASSLFSKLRSKLNPNKPVAFVFNKLDELFVDNKDNKARQFYYLLPRLLYHSESRQRKQLYNFEDAYIHNASAFELISKVYDHNILTPENITNDNYNWFAVSSMIDRQFKNETDKRIKSEKLKRVTYFFGNRESVNVHEPLMWLLYKILWEESK